MTVPQVVAKYSANSSVVMTTALVHLLQNKFDLDIAEIDRIITIAVSSTPAVVASAGAAPAGGVGATAGAYDTSAHRDALITLVNNMRTALINAGLMS